MGTPAKRLKDHIKEKGIKQSFISEKTGIDKSTLSAILNGKTKLTVDNLELICWVIDCSPGQFLMPRAPGSVITNDKEFHQN